MRTRETTVSELTQPVIPAIADTALAKVAKLLGAAMRQLAYAAATIQHNNAGVAVESMAANLDFTFRRHYRITIEIVEMGRNITFRLITEAVDNESNRRRLMSLLADEFGEHLYPTSNCEALQFELRKGALL
jgi:hypothetical protein